MKNTLEPPDIFPVDAAKGWLELGDNIAANDELENVSARLRSHPDVLEVRWRIYAKAKMWEACVDIAAAIIKVAPGRSDGWIRLSYALHELGRTQDAFDNLLPVTDKFPKLWTMPYNLSCYCAQLGRLNQCREWLKNAMAIDEHAVERAAIDDPDLKPLWDSMNGTLWKRAD